jgi:hypothetical protein
MECFAKLINWILSDSGEVYTGNYVGDWAPEFGWPREAGNFGQSSPDR